jgi:transcriptional regulator with XRE-family HTH domain
MYSLDPTPLQICKQIAQRHKLLRKKLRLSQKEMAERSGVSLGSLKRFENTGKISLEMLLKLAHLMGRLNDFETIFQIEKDLHEVEKLFTNRKYNEGYK